MSPALRESLKKEAAKWKRCLEFFALQYPELRPQLQELLMQLLHALQRATSREQLVASSKWVQAKILEIAGEDRCAAPPRGWVAAAAAATACAQPSLCGSSTAGRTQIFV